jgi:D-mannonate dehydratase
MAIRHSKPSQAAFILDLGPEVSISITRAAEEELTGLPRKAMTRLVEGLKAWAKVASIREVRAMLYTDPEDESWSYVLVELKAGIGEQDFEQLSEELAEVDQASVDKLAPKDRERIIGSYQVVLTRASEWDDKPAFCV